MCFVYILQSKRNDKYYVGSTNSMDRRLLEHNSGHTKYTRENGPFSLIFKQDFPDLLTARKIELWLKRQKSKLLLIHIIQDGKINKVF